MSGSRSIVHHTYDEECVSKLTSAQTLEVPDESSWKEFLNSIATKESDTFWSRRAVADHTAVFLPASRSCISTSPGSSLLVRSPPDWNLTFYIRVDPTGSKMKYFSAIICRCYGCINNGSAYMKHPSKDDAYTGGHLDTYSSFGCDRSDSDNEEDEETRIRRMYADYDVEERIVAELGLDKDPPPNITEEDLRRVFGRET